MESTNFIADALQVAVYPDIEQMGAAAAEKTAQTILEMLSVKDHINMIFAAAPSQEAFLKSLVADPRIPWDRINAFHMDEYAGICPDAPQSFANFLRARIFDKVPFRSVYCLQGNAPDLEAECGRYAALLDEYPVDIVCLGIGENGHIAFNDPDVADFNDSRNVKLVALDNVCRQQQVNEKCFDTLDLVPKYAMTVTIPALIRAKYMICIVPFRSKASAVRSAVHDEISEKCPATILRTRQNSFLYLESNSASLL